MLMLFTMQIGKGENMEYWKQIDIVTLTIIRNELVEVGNMLDDQKLPIDELIDRCLEKIDHCVDELSFYCEKEEENESKRTN